MVALRQGGQEGEDTMSTLSRTVCAGLATILAICAPQSAIAEGVEDILGFDVDGVTVTMTPAQIDDELVAQGYERLDVATKAISTRQSQSHYRDEQADSTSEISARAWDDLVEQVEMTMRYQGNFDVARERTSLIELLGEPDRGCNYLEKMARFGCTWVAGAPGAQARLEVDLSRNGGVYSITRDVPRD